MLHVQTTPTYIQVYLNHKTGKQVQLLATLKISYIYIQTLSR